MPKEVTYQTPGNGCPSHVIKGRLHTTKPAAVLTSDVLSRGAVISPAELREIADVLHEMANGIDGLHGWPQHMRGLVEFTPLLSEQVAGDLFSSPQAQVGLEAALGVLTMGGEEVLRMVQSAATERYHETLSQMTGCRDHLAHLLSLTKGAIGRLQAVGLYHADELTLAAASPADSGGGEQ